MSTSTQKNYMDLMDEFFFQTKKLGAKATDEQILEVLHNSKTLIDEIAALAREKPLFKKSIEQYEEFKTDIFSDVDVNDHAVFIYKQLVELLASAPTSLHFRSTIVLIMPLLSDALAMEGE